MKMDKQSYYAEASSWAQSDTAGARRARNVAWMVAGAAALIAVAEAFALASLAPLKSTSVVPVLVDRQTGFVEVLDKDGSQALRADTALTRSMLAQYVAAREGFNITTVGADYRRVMLWSAGRARNDYAALMPAQNPQSPLRIYPRTAQVSVNIESVSDLGPRTALVRFTTTRVDDGAPASAASYYAAVITYQFSDTPLRAEDRLVNPLGFQVIRYERSDEAAPSKPPRTVLDIPIAPSAASSSAGANPPAAEREP
jgi:type IV secretion system protein VirB8